MRFTLTTPKINLPSGFQAEYILIPFLTLLVHGITLFNDGVFYDDYVLYIWGGQRDWIRFSEYFLQAGLPISMIYNWFLTGFPNVVLIFRIVSLVSIMSTGILVYRIGIETRWLSRGESMMVALFMLSYPAFQVAFKMDVAHYVATNVLFYLAFLLALFAEKKKGKSSWVLRIAALLFFFISFNYTSNLVFYYGFLLLLFLFIRQIRALYVKDLIVAIFPKRLDYVVLPIVFWVIKESFFPRHGMFAYYNQFNFNIKSLLDNSLKFIDSSITSQIIRSFTLLVRFPLIGLLLVILVLLFYSFTHRQLRSWFNGRLHPVWMLTMGVILFVLGMFPYVVVGESPNPSGWLTRWSIMILLPMALLLIASIRLAFENPDGSLSRWGWVVVVLCMGTFSANLNLHYIDWNAKWVNDLSIMYHLRQTNLTNNYSLYFVFNPSDKVDNTRKYTFDFENYGHVSTDYTGMFVKVWGDQSRYALAIPLSTSTAEMQNLELNPDTNSPRNGADFTFASEFDPKGCRAVLTISSGPANWTNFDLMFHYLYYKLLHPSEMSMFLDGIINIYIQPINSSKAIHCNLFPFAR